MSGSTKKLGEIIVAIIFIAAAVFLFIELQYGWGVAMLIALIILLKLDTLQKLVLHPKNGLTAEFTLQKILERKDNLYVNVHDDIKVSESVEAGVDVQRYVAEVVQVGGVNSHLYTRIVWVPEEGGWYLNPSNLWASIGFNRGGDVMWLNCKEGYEIENFSSPSGNSILSDAINIGSCGILLEDKLKNELIINCKKKI